MKNLGTFLAPTSVMFPTQVATERNITDVHCRIDPLCIGLWLCCCHIVAPLCKISWMQPDHVMELWIHVVCLVSISLVYTIMDL
jgi:hypothetical protein